MTLFAGYFPYKMFIPVIDNFFREGWPAIYRMSLALLKLWENEFLQLNDIAFVAKKLYELREDFNIKPETLFTLAYSPSIDKAFGTDGNLLVLFEQEFFKSQIETKLKQSAGTWTAAERKLLPIL